MRDYGCSDDSMAATRSKVRMLKEVAISIGSSSSCTDLAACSSGVNGRVSGESEAKMTASAGVMGRQ